MDQPAWRRYLRLLGLDINSDVDDELQFHIQTKIEELIGAGKNPRDARREAIRQFGPLDTVRKECERLSQGHHRTIHRREYFAGWSGDIRYAVRVLWKAKIFAAGAILILAAGIGANIAVFTLLDRLLLAPLPVPDPAQLPLVSCSGFAVHDDGSRASLSCRYD